MTKNKRSFHSAIFVVFLLCVWECCGRWLIPNNYFLPPFSSVAETLLHEIRNGDLLLQCGYSFLLAIAGIGVSCLITVVLFCLCAVSNSLDFTVNTLCDILNPIPSVAIIPLAMFVFGLGDNVLILLICHSVVWPMLKNMLAGYHSINSVYLDFFRNAKLNKIVYLCHVIIPSVTKDILVGLKIAWGRAFRTLIAVEMVFGTTGSIGGLGFYIYKARANAETGKLYAGILLISLLGIFMEKFLFCALEKHTINKWGVSGE